MSILTKAQVLQMVDKGLIFPMIPESASVELLDFQDNKISPEPFAYKVTFTCSVLGEARSITFYPNTVGIQGKTKLKGKRLK